MSPLIIDLRGITVDLLQPTDNPVLADAIREAAGPAPEGDGAGYDNHGGFGNKL